MLDRCRHVRDAGEAQGHRSRVSIEQRDRHAQLSPLSSAAQPLYSMPRRGVPLASATCGMYTQDAPDRLAQNGSPSWPTTTAESSSGTPRSARCSPARVQRAVARGLLEWSDAQRSTPVRREFGSAPTATAEATGSAEQSAARQRPRPPAVDLGVLRGDDPAANAEQAVALLGGMGRFVKRATASSSSRTSSLRASHSTRPPRTRPSSQRSSGWAGRRARSR